MSTMQQLVRDLEDANGGNKPKKVVLPAQLCSEKMVLGVEISPSEEGCMEVTFATTIFTPIAVWAHDGESNSNQRNDVDWQAEAERCRNATADRIVRDWVSRCSSAGAS